MTDYCDQHIKTVETLAVISNELAHLRKLYEGEANMSKEHRIESIPIRDTVHNTERRTTIVEGEIVKIYELIKGQKFKDTIIASSIGSLVTLAVVAGITEIVKVVFQSLYNLLVG